jgi:hypothetical protein
MAVHVEQARAARRAYTRSMAVATLLVAASCGKRAAPAYDSTGALAPALPETTAAAPAATSGSAMAPVRGTITVVSDTSVTVSTATGTQQIHLVAPVRVYTRTASDLAHVTPNAFVGITSVAQADGSQRATEIHIFPEALRGTGEGSRLMEQTAGGGGRSTMTNGAVAPSRMTNGNVSGSRMTNGTVDATGGGTSRTITYQGGTQTIAIPAGVTVTSIVPTQAKLAVGANVVVLAHPGADGRPSASSVMLSGPPARGATRSR